jgi:lysophospholipase L1-like esterase
MELARQAGITAIDLLDVYKSAPSMEQLQIAKWDGHPNAMAHRMIAEALYPALAPQLGL